MSKTTSTKRDPPAPKTTGPAQWRVLQAVLLGGFLVVVISIVLLIDLLPSRQVVLNAGDVSTEDILAPTDLTYESEVRTQQAQDTQAAAVQEIFDPPDASVARQQEILARQIGDYIGTVRQDTYASAEDKTQSIAAIPDLSLSADDIAHILSLSEEDWQEVREETVRVLLLAMQGEIKEAQLDTVRRRLPTLVSYRLTDTQTDAVIALTRDLVKANTFFNAARTDEARQIARESTAPVSITVREGEALVRAGDLVRPVNIEALDAFGIRQQAARWESVLGTILFALVTTCLLVLFTIRLESKVWQRGRTAAVTFALVAIFVVLAKLMLPATDADAFLAYLYPLPALSMILTVLFGPALGMAVGVIVSFVGTFISGGSVQLAVYLLAGAMMGALVLSHAERIRSFLQAGLFVALTNVTVIVLFGLLAPEQDPLKIAIGALIGVVMGGLSASLALAAFFALSSFLDVITPFQLMELSRPTHPLFRQLLLKAPGTYHHSLLLSNMAEEAANQIGADGLMARVGSYYHDIGKTVRPFFFTENRVGDVNPHERLDPHTSARIILSHVQDGLDLAEKYNLPTAIRAFIPEHHGTSLVLAFYRMAVKASANNGDDVLEEDFRYPGPKPQSKVTAIVMLADSCEARVRSARPDSNEEIDRILRETIKSKLDSGQLDECDLTLHDLDQTRIAFLSVLQGVFHPRVQYPSPVKVKGADGQEVIR
ncbi:HD family phosphohydrolase [Chloroflexota bacterium]